MQYIFTNSIHLSSNNSLILELFTPGYIPQASAACTDLIAQKVMENWDTQEHKSC